VVVVGSGLTAVSGPDERAVLVVLLGVAGVGLYPSLLCFGVSMMLQLAIVGRFGQYLVATYCDSLICFG
jgi:hypothetical protein